MNTFRFGESKNPHNIGQRACPACRWDTPQPCPQCGEGLIHVEMNPRSYGPSLIFHCDTCAGKGKGWREVT